MDTELERRYKQFIDKVIEYNPDADLKLITQAFEFAKVAHFEEKRLSGADFVWHPLETAMILAGWKMDIATLVAALLHDTIDHGAATKDDILENFGEEIFMLVDGVTSVSKVRLKGSMNEAFVENLRKMFLAIAKDLRIVFLRLAERLDNLTTLEYLPEKSRVPYAREGLEIYAPLAERLGMGKLKSQLDDLSFKYAESGEYEKVVKLSMPYFKNAEQRIIKMKNRMLSELEVHKVMSQVYGRRKGYYSLYMKLIRPYINWNLSLIHDYLALRILVNKVEDCYLALGLLHKVYKPVPEIPIADYISTPKPNGYRSIHTKVYGPDNKIVEVQIRTFEMHEQAEYGLSAHWAYSDLKSNKKKIDDAVVERGVAAAGSKLEWVKQLAQWQKEISDSDEFLKAVKFDALSKRIFVFSPKGDVFDLPENSTPVDYAYAVHTTLGEYVKGAKVDGRIVPLDYKLRNGEVVEILKFREKKLPNSNWLDFAVTTMARREIKKKLRVK